MIIEPLIESDYIAWSQQYVDYAKPWNELISSERLLEVWKLIQSHNSSAYSLGAFDENHQLLGFAQYILTPCTYSRRQTCYLQDLYVASPYRRQGIAQKLIESLKVKGKKDKWRAITWRTRPDNTSAISLYERIAERSNWIYFEIQF